MCMIDIIFPLNLPPLTYLCPEELQKKAEIGKLVTAPLRGRIEKGIILEISSNKKHIAKKTYKFKEISDIPDRDYILTKKNIKLIEWIKDYYYSEIGLVLKSMLPKEFFKDIKRRKISKTRSESIDYKTIDLNFPIISDEIYSPIRCDIQNKVFSTTLLHSPSYEYEIAFLMTIIKDMDNIIILCPEIIEAEYVSSLIKTILNKSVCLIHSDIKGSRRSEAYEGIINGRYSTVVGTMSSILVPIKKTSLIVVLEEHSPFYKHDKLPRYNARDVAIMRGSIENTPVLLMSLSPSIISLYNSLKGKYRLIRPEYKTKRPKVHIINIKKTREIISERVVQSIKKSLQYKMKSLVIINKKGYSIIRCADCGHIDECPKCNISLFFYKDKTLRCHKCGFKKGAKNMCDNCSGVSFENLGAGTQRVEETIKLNIPVIPLRLDSDLIKNRRAFKQIYYKAFESSVIIGTKLIAKNILFNNHYHIIAMINPDLYFYIPDYLSMERLFQHIIYLSEMANEKGKIFLQTFSPENKIFDFLKSYDYYGFFKYEMQMRSELFYPPFSRMASILFHYRSSNKNDESTYINDLPINLSELPSYIKIMGPIPSNIHRKGFNKSAQIILKAKDRTSLHNGIRIIYDKARSKKIRLDIDIDPVSFL